VVVGGGVLAGGRVVTGSVFPQENGLYQTICYSVSFLSIRGALLRCGTRRMFGGDQLQR
jgi:hypothetical protein